MNDHPAPNSRMVSDDDALRQQLRALFTPAAPPDALTDRVMAQWHQLHPDTTALGHSGAALTLGDHAADQRRRRLTLSAALLVGVLVIAAWWLQRPDPSLDELMQADVLSQMAIGEL